MGTLQQNIDAAEAMLVSLRGLDDLVERAAKLISDALAAGQKLLACGNGGSAAEAGHLTTELVSRFRRDRRPYPAICLNAHGGDLTAIANDYAFDDVFARQVDAFAQPGDVLVAITTSGRSTNVQRAVESASRRNVRIVTLLGRDGGTLRNAADVELLVDASDTARIQEGHLLLIHAICQCIEQRLGHDASPAR
ncbi:SIS domain-containing protein [Phycisphaerales bacterium AB-hyl4]|uniref:SIS domain-containing protein n=1 Tax=Natronomicrosphaera hydrolytica TaxID=3242702 RepID=A0ABV4U6Q5_9BACT